jgi:hypothetical protein
MYVVDAAIDDTFAVTSLDDFFRLGDSGRPGWNPGPQRNNLDLGRHGARRATSG